MNTSFEVVVLSTLDKHHHKEDLEFTTLDYYHWTVQQEKVPHSSFIENYDSRNYSFATSHFFIHSILFPFIPPLHAPSSAKPCQFCFTDYFNCHHLIQIVAQSLAMHKKNNLILEELRWFNLVNGSGNLPSLLQVTSSYLELESSGSLLLEVLGPWCRLIDSLC